MASKVYLWQLSQEVIDFIIDNGGNSGGGSSASGPVWGTIGTIKRAMAKSSKEVLPQVSCTFSNAGIHETGEEVNGTAIALSIKNLDSVTVPLDSVNFYKDSTLLYSQKFAPGQSIYLYNAPYIITSDCTFKAEVTYNEGAQSAFGVGSFTFVNPSYYGVIPEPEDPQKDLNRLKSKMSKVLNGSKDFTWDGIVADNQCLCYMYPEAFGLLEKAPKGYSMISTTIVAINDREVPYLAYLSKPTTMTNGKQTYA